MTDNTEVRTVPAADADRSGSGDPAASAEGEAAESNDDLVASLGHPRGTLAIVLIYALLFAVVWMGLYIFEFLGRGGPQP